MKCQISIKGCGRSDHGRLKNDWAGTVKEAIKDWDVFYRAVFNHVKDCDKCLPDDILLAYWNLRQQPKHGGKMSGTLANLVVRYLRIGANPALVKEFLKDDFNIDVALKVHHLFDDEELYEMVKNAYFDVSGLAEFHERTIQRIEKVLKKKDRPLVRNMLLLAKCGVPIPPMQELERLAAVAEVTTS